MEPKLKSLLDLPTNSTSYGEDLMNRQNTSVDSITSVTFPWRITQQRRCNVPSDTEVGREVNPVSFYLCMSSVMLLTTGVSVSAAALWAFIYKLPYIQLLRNVVPITNDVLSLWIGLLCIPCFWISSTLHNTNKHIMFLPLLMLLYSLCIVMLIVSACISLSFKSQIKLDPNLKSPQLVLDYFQKQLNESFFISMQLYMEDSQKRSAWNKIQQRLKCCGTNGYVDWIVALNKVPSSCFDEKGELFTSDCLNKTAFDLLWEASLTFGLNLIMLFVQIFAISVTFSAYVSQYKNN